MTLPGALGKPTERMDGRRKREGVLGFELEPFRRGLLWVFAGRRSKDSGLERVRILKSFLLILLHLQQW